MSQKENKPVCANFLCPLKDRCATYNRQPEGDPHVYVVYRYDFNPVTWAVTCKNYESDREVHSD